MTIFYCNYIARSQYVNTIRQTTRIEWVFFSRTLKDTMSWPLLRPGSVVVHVTDAQTVITKLMRAQHPPWSVFANFFLKKLKYKHSKSNIRAANSVPPISNKNADKNCSRANGSLVAFWSWSSGLHVPVIQNRWSLSRSPAETPETRA